MPEGKDIVRKASRQHIQDTKGLSHNLEKLGNQRRKEHGVERQAFG
jgi:hypothetical protein